MSSQKTEMKKGMKDRKWGVRVGCPWEPLRLSHTGDWSAYSMPQKCAAQQKGAQGHPLLTNGSLWLCSQLLVQLSISLGCQRNHQTETTMMALKIRSCPTGNCPSYLQVHSNGLRWGWQASSNTNHLVDGTIGRWVFDVPSLVVFIERCLYPKHLCISALCRSTFLSTSVLFRLAFCSIPLSSSPLCHACLPQSIQSGFVKSQPQPYLSTPLVCCCCCCCIQNQVPKSHWCLQRPEW